MVRHADMEIIITKGEVYVHRSLETGDMACHAGPHGEVPGWSEGRGKGEHGWEFLWEGVGKAGKVC